MHECAEMKAATKYRSISIYYAGLDEAYTPVWELRQAFSEFDVSLRIAYCPWCGKRLGRPSRRRPK